MLKIFLVPIVYLQILKIGNLFPVYRTVENMALKGKHTVSSVYCMENPNHWWYIVKGC